MFQMNSHRRRNSRLSLGFSPESDEGHILEDHRHAHGLFHLAESVDQCVFKGLLHVVSDLPLPMPLKNELRGGVTSGSARNMHLIILV